MRSPHTLLARLRANCSQASRCATALLVFAACDGSDDTAQDIEAARLAENHARMQEVLRRIGAPGADSLARGPDSTGLAGANDQSPSDPPRSFTVRSSAEVAGSLYLLSTVGDRALGEPHYLVEITTDANGAHALVHGDHDPAARNDWLALRGSADSLIIVGRNRSTTIVNGSVTFGEERTAGDAPPPKPLGYDDGPRAIVDSTPGRPRTWWSVEWPLGAAADSIEQANGDVTLVGINEVTANGMRFHRVPSPSYATFAQLRPERARPPADEAHAVLGAGIGAWQQIGRQIWFGVRFFESEAHSGVGGLGAFDLDSQRFEMLWGMGTADHSISAFHFDGDRVWLAVVEDCDCEQPKPRGVVRYAYKTKEVTSFPVPGLITGMGHLGGAMVFAGTDGIFMVRGTTLSDVPVTLKR
jgi:hypothetical protein